MKKNKVLAIAFLTLIYIICLNTSFAETNSTANLSLNCKANIAINADDNTVLFENNAYERIYPASTTKILTAIIAIENLELDKEIEVTEDMVSQIPYDSSVMGLKAGEVYTLKDLLYGLLLVSGNDVAIVLADTISGDMDSFALLMNEKQKEIGCENTNFVNAHGYHDDNHYTTAYDMALIMSYCIKNETFREIMETRSISVAPINNKDRVFLLENSNYMFYEDSGVYAKEIQGGKTGFTYEAQGTFIGYAKKDDMTIIIGSFGGGRDENNLSSRFSDTKKISDYIFENYEKVLFAKKGDYPFSFIDLNNSKIYTLGLAEDLYCVIPKNFISNYTVNISNNKLNANVGSITINFPANNLSYTRDLTIISYKNYYDNTKLAIYISIIIIMLLITTFPIS